MDNIPFSLIKKCILYIVNPLVHICNECLETGSFPSKLKVAKIIPIYKKGDRECADNYRPISLLPAISKIFKKIIYNRLIHFFDANNILSEHQNGFRKKRSTMKTIENTIRNIVDGLENDKQTVGIFCDLSKAFDCISHRILLNKLEYYGIRGGPLKLMKSYLKGRTQHVEIIAISNTNEESKYL
jgi:Reverse transcriptase (RNA-dependent DNA polymerase)